jgi:uncharacterized protein YkwD
MTAPALTALSLALALPFGTTHRSSDAAALATVASACANATTAAASPKAELAAMVCGANVVRQNFRRAALRPKGQLDHSALLKADAIRRCGFTHTPCGASFARTFQQVGYLRGRGTIGENLAWGQSSLGSPVGTLAAWLHSPHHRANLLSRGWTDVGVAYERGNLFGLGGVSLWVMQFGRR